MVLHPAPTGPAAPSLGRPAGKNSAVEGRVSRVKRSAIGEADARRALLTLAPEPPTSEEPGGREYVTANVTVTDLGV